MRVLDVDGSELGSILFGDISDIEQMDSTIPFEDRMRILHREFHVDSDGKYMEIRPVCSNTVLRLRLSTDLYHLDSGKPIIGVVFGQGDLPEPSVRLAFCHFKCKADYHDSITEGLTMVGCFFDSAICLESSAFSGSVMMDCSTFRGDVLFAGSSFNRAVSFCNCTFGGRCDFNSSEFRGKASFRSSCFNGDADFDDATFRSKALFNRLVRIRDDKSNDPTCFHGRASFHSARFDHYAQFHETSFLSKVDFNSTVFNGKTFFEGVVKNEPYYTDIKFRRTHFGP